MKIQDIIMESIQESLQDTTVPVKEDEHEETPINGKEITEELEENESSPLDAAIIPALAAGTGALALRKKISSIAELETPGNFNEEDFEKMKETGKKAWGAISRGAIKLGDKAVEKYNEYGNMGKKMFDNDLENGKAASRKIIANSDVVKGEKLKAAGAAGGAGAAIAGAAGYLAGKKKK